jgi:uncharacterized protein (DUF58 family)
VIPATPDPGTVLADAADLASALGPLSLSALRTRSGGDLGAHRRRRAGSGAEFWQFRDLRTGEAASRIDWRRSARSDELFVQEREQENPARLALMLDTSGSMQFASAPALPTKLSRAATLLTAIGLSAMAADEVVSVGSAAALYEGDLAEKLLRRPLSPPGSATLTIAASDFLDRGGPVHDVMTAPGTVLALQIIDPAEDEFPFSGHVRFEPLEAEEQREIGSAATIREPYLTAWSRHCETLRTKASEQGHILVQHRTDASLEPALDRIAAMIREGGSIWAA